MIKYIWFWVTPCMYLLARQSLFFSELSLFILLPRSTFIGLIGRLLSSSEKNCPAFKLLPGRKVQTNWVGLLLQIKGSLLTALPRSEFLKWSQLFDQLALVRRLTFITLMPYCFVPCIPKYTGNLDNQNIKRASLSHKQP